MLVFSLILVVTVGFMRRELAVSENLTEASVEVCANLSETLTITRTVSANVSVQPGKGEAEGQLNKHSCSFHFTAFKIVLTISCSFCSEQ